MLIPLNPPVSCPACKAAGRDSFVQFDTGAPNDAPYRCDGDQPHTFAEEPAPVVVPAPVPVSVPESVPPVVEIEPTPAPAVIEPTPEPIAMTPPRAPPVQVPDGYELVQPAAESAPVAAAVESPER
jgi:hypothetical protein